MMNIKHILSRGHRAGGLAEASGTPGFAMRFIMSLLLMVTLGGVSSMWAQSPTIATGIYKIACSIDDRGFMIDNGSNGTTLSKNKYNTGRYTATATNDNALWYFYKNDDGTYFIASLSSQQTAAPKYLTRINDNFAGYSNSPVKWNVTFKAQNRRGSNNGQYAPAHVTDNFNYFELQPQGQSKFLLSAPGNNSDPVRFGNTEVNGTYWEFQSVEEGVLSSAQTTLLNTIKASFTPVTFTVIITGDKKSDEVITYKNNKRFTSAQPSMLANGNATATVGHNGTLTFKPGIQPSDLLDCDFTSSAASRTNGTSFVYGPVIDWVNHTITCEIREAITALPETGWYQLKWDVSTGNNDNAANRYTNAAENQYTNPVRDNNRFYLTMPKGGVSGRSEYLTYSPYPTNETTPLTYVKLVRSGSSIMMMTLDGRYVQEDGSPSTSGSGYLNGARYVADGELDLRQWYPFANLSYIMGKSGNSHNYFYTTPAKFDDSRYEFYEVCIHYEGMENSLVKGRSITYTGSATNYSMPTVFSGGYLVFPSGTDITTSQYTVNNTNPSDIISNTVDKANHRIKIELKLPKIIHRQHATFDHLATVGAAQKPNSKFIQEGKGLIDHPNAANFTGAGYTDNDRKIQNTSVFHLTQYAKKGETTKVRMPFRRERDGSVGKINKYQRWYDYKTERCLDEDIIQGLSGYTMYYNGIAKTGVTDIVDIKLPNDKEEIFVGVDNSEFNDYSTDPEGNFIEPSLSMRTIIHVVSAEKMASALVAKGGEDKWWEDKTYIVPNIKRGSATHRNNSDLLPLDMPFSNYWIYDNSHNLMRIVNENGNYSTLENNLSIVVEGTAASYITAGIFKEAGNQTTGPGLHDPAGVSCNHFIYYKVKGDGLTREVPAGSQAIIKIYARNGVSGTEYQLAKFTLNFQADCEPLAITSVVGNENSTRSRDYFLNQKMAEVASLTFSEKKVGFKGFGGVGGSDTHYAFPLDPTRTSYAFSPDDAFGGYRITKNAYCLRAYPVSLYERNIKTGETSLTPVDDDYYLYIDAAETPGQVASIPLDGNLCAGTRLFFYGWLNSQNPFESNAATAASVILELVGKKEGKEIILASYAPGVISDAAYTPEGGIVRSVDNGSTASELGAWGQSNYNAGDHTVATRIAAWQSIGFSYLLTESGFDGFELRVINNCYSTAGGDYSLDDFRVFVNPPKGSVDFTTPLCSDKVRHAKIHSDFDMLKNISNVNETAPGAKLSVSYCFLEADVFDNYSAGGLTISDIFEVDAQTGNHNLKAAYKSNPAAITLINNAFGKALVGTRQLASADPEKGGFHTFDISLNYESLPEYAYNDSKNEVIYREEGTDGIRRIVFKEDVIRGEMAQIEYDGQKHYPHMRPSTTYYLVFSPKPVVDSDITGHTVGTSIFSIQDNCSFFGKFKTKDPLHVILDNADIESDLPVKAVCHGETTAFQFNLPAMKVDKPIVDEAYCISDKSLDGKIVPESQGLNHYKYEASFKSNDISGVIKNLPYDWWMGGKYDETHSYRGTIEDYLAATHPTRTYSGPKDIAHKQDGALVKIAQAMEDFRFYYPDFGKNGGTLDWSTVTKKDYNSDTGYGLLDSEINTIKDFVTAGIIILHRNTYDMPLTYEEAEELQAKELSDMMEKEMNDQILALALELNDASIQSLLPLKQLEGTVLSKLSENGRLKLTLEELGSFTLAQLKGIATALMANGKLTDITAEQINAMSEGELRRTIENALRAMTDLEMQAFASNESNFPNIGHEKRAYLVVRALNILSRETVAKLPEADQQNTTIVRAKLREQMISIFSAQQVEVLRKMWSDVSAKLTEEERAALLKDELHPETPKNPATMNADDLAVLVEDGLAQLTNNVINDLQGDRYVHFTLIPIMPSQETFVDEPYIFCPDPRGVKLRITSNAPKMLDGFADMTYPEDMENVPVRLGLPQIKETMASTSKTLRIPVRGLKQAAKNGVKAVKLDKRTGYYNEIFLVETDDPQYQQTVTTGMAEAKNSAGVYTRMIGTIQEMVATYPTALDKTPNNYLVVKFKDDMKFYEGYTYRVGINFMEHDSEDHETISCPGEMRLDLKIVPEYQKWTASVNSDWTNDQNWARADRTELNADNAATGSVIAGSTDITVAANYLTNEANKKSSSFVPMYFTNVLVDGNAGAPVLYPVTAASRGEKKFLQGLTSDDATQAQHIYDMEVAPSTGAWHTNNNYECTLFGTYVANGITFKPGSQLINAQHLTYNKAWVEYELTTNRWYTLASPLQNTFAGEWYSPTAGGKQLTPHFYDINYSTSLNDRFRPAYYQRSWDSQGNNPVYLKTGGTQEAYIMADWSYVYNDVKKEYSNGGFSVMVDDTHMGDDSPADHKALNRMPKADTQYTYYDIDGKPAENALTDNLSQKITNKRNRLWSDELNSSDGTFSHTITNYTTGNNFFLVANPFMANMDMDEFFAANSEKIESKFWIMTANGQEVSVKTETGWVTTSDQVTTLGKSAPLQGFFVKGKSASNTVEITYTAAMQAQASVAEQLKSKAKAFSDNETQMLTLKAQYGDMTSTAVVALGKNAQKTFVTTEDCETFIDSNIADLPTIYTVASGQAMTVNTVPEVDMIPIGILGETGQTVDVTFSGMSGLCLYDSKDNSYTDISEGTEVTMEAKTTGRYFITSSSSTTAIDGIATDAPVRKGIYTLGGQYVGEDVKTLAPGLYIVNGVKMRVK